MAEICGRDTSWLTTFSTMWGSVAPAFAGACDLLQLTFKFGSHVLCCAVVQSKRERSPEAAAAAGGEASTEKKKKKKKKEKAGSDSE